MKETIKKTRIKLAYKKNLQEMAKESRENIKRHEISSEFPV